MNVMTESMVNVKSETTKCSDTANASRASRKRRLNVLIKRVALAIVLSGSYWLGSSDFIARILNDASQIDNGTMIASCINVSLIIYASLMICWDFET